MQNSEGIPTELPDSISQQNAPDSFSYQNVPDSVEAILEIPQYEDWQKATISGKLKMSGLPLSPGVRIYMQKDSLVELSIKAPFLGEVGRIILTADSVTGINKMNKSYTSAPLKDFLHHYPGGIGDIQDLFLARVVFPGYGEMKDELAEFVEVYEHDNDFAVVPGPGIAIPNVDYGYIVNEDFMPLVLLVIPEAQQSLNLTIGYEYSNDGYDMSVNYTGDGSGLNFALNLNFPQWDGEPLKPIKLDKKYTKLPITDFIRNFGR